MEDKTVSELDSKTTISLQGEVIPLFNNSLKTVENVELDKAIHEIYYLKFRIPTDEELVASNIHQTSNEIKLVLSKHDSFIPLYDAFTTNIYLIQKRNVYIRVVRHDYRFPDDLIINTVKELKNKKLKKLAKHPDLQNDKVFMRYIRKIDMMVDFMNQFDQSVLYNTYLDVFYRYAPELGNATYTCIRRSFIPHKKHLSPYYTKDEVLKLGMNMELIKLPENVSFVDFKDTLSTEDYKNICNSIQINDVSADILIQHQNYIIKNDLVGLVQYYTLQGSYFMNKYLRGGTTYEYRNNYLEENIKKIWKLVLNAPAFDKNYILYRFVGTDNFLAKLKIGDVFRDKGFVSTTRDPFYRNDTYKFGAILLKIIIPKGIKGVGLCLETLSHFSIEEEIILPPLTKLKLISKDNECVYHHPDERYGLSIKKKYEFVWEGNTNIVFSKKPEPPEETQTIDFLNIKNVKMVSLKEKIDYLVKTHFDPMNRIKCTIGTNSFYVVGEWYDSTGAYADMYSIKTSDGFSLYTIYKGHILFMIEIGESDGKSQIRVNYYTKYSNLNRSEIMGDDNFIKFISSVAYYFEIPNVVIYADYMNCDLKMDESPSKTTTKLFESIPKEMSRGNLSRPTNERLEDFEHLFESNLNKIRIKSQRSFMNPLKMKSDKILSQFKDSTIDNIETHEELNNTDSIEIDEQEGFMGGSYCIDFYRFIKFNEKRYYNNNSELNASLNAEIQPMFSYYDLEQLKTTSPLKILKKEDRDEVYQLYIKSYLESNAKNTLADFYVWMIENKCYLMDIFINKMDRLYRQENPFKKGMYVLDAMAYLYNRRYIHTYSRFIKILIDENHQILNLPKNNYRIRR